MGKIKVSKSKKKISKKTMKLVILIAVSATIVSSAAYYLVWDYRHSTQNYETKKQELTDSISKEGAQNKTLKLVKKQIDGITNYVKDENSEVTLLKQLTIISDMVGKDNIKSAEPKFKEFKTDENYCYIPVTISFNVNDLSLIDFFKSFKTIYPEPKFENLSIEYKEHKLIATVDLISISVKTENPKNDTIQNIVKNVKDSNVGNSKFGTLIDYDKQAGGSATSGVNNNGGAADNGTSKITIGSPTTNTGTSTNKTTTSGTTNKTTTSGTTNKTTSTTTNKTTTSGTTTR